MRKYLLILLLILLVIVSVASFVILRSSKQASSAQKTMISDKYTFSNVVIPEIDNQLKSVGIDKFTQTVEVVNSTDSAKIVAWSGTSDNRKSCFGFKVLGLTIQITIYVSPSLSQNDALLEVNKEYISALYYSVEFKKSSPSYENSIPVSFGVFKQVASNKTFPIILK